MKDHFLGGKAGRSGLGEIENTLTFLEACYKRNGTSVLEGSTDGSRLKDFSAWKHTKRKGKGTKYNQI